MAGFFRKWIDEALGGGEPARQTAVVSDQYRFQDLMGRGDPWPQLIRLFDGLPGQLLLSAGPDGAIWPTKLQRNVLVLGPSRSNKSAGSLASLIMAAPGPTVVVSTKSDLARATAQVRSRLGQVWHFAPDGTPTLPGMLQLRWSPITGAESWTRAVARAKSMAEGAEMSGRGGEGGDGAIQHFTDLAIETIAPVLHAAALAGQPIDWVLDVLQAPTERRTREVVKFLSTIEGASPRALSQFEGILDSDERTRGNIFATARRSFAAYAVEGAVATTENPNFDPEDFVLGEPGAFNPLRFTDLDAGAAYSGIPTMANRVPLGAYDTIYVTATGEDQAQVAPLIVGLLSDLRRTAYALHSESYSDDSGLTNHSARQPMVWILDEMAGIAPIKDLPKMLADCASQGLLIVSGLQDLGLAEAKWGLGESSFLQLYGEVVVYQGIRNDKTLQALSKIIGQHWVQQTGESHTQTRGRESSTGYTQSVSNHLVDRLSPRDIATGHPQDPDGVLPLFLRPDNNWYYGRVLPYFSEPFWLEVFLATMETIAAQPIWDSRIDLQIPEIDRDGDGRYLRQASTTSDLYGRFQAARQTLLSHRRERKALLASRSNALLLSASSLTVAASYSPPGSLCYLVLDDSLDVPALDAEMERLGFLGSSRGPEETPAFSWVIDGQTYSQPARWSISVAGDDLQVAVLSPQSESLMAQSLGAWPNIKALFATTGRHVGLILAISLHTSLGYQLADELADELAQRCYVLAAANDANEYDELYLRGPDELEYAQGDFQ